MNVGKEIFFREINQHLLFGHITHQDLIKMEKLKQEISSDQLQGQLDKLRSVMKKK